MNKPRLLWPSLKRLLIYGNSFRKPIIIAVLISWVAAGAEICGPLLVSYFIDNMLAKAHIPLESTVMLIIVFLHHKLLLPSYTIIKQFYLIKSLSVLFKHYVQMS